MSGDELREAESLVATCRRARTRAEELAVEIATEQRACQALRARLRDEQEDVDALDDASVRSVIARLRGRREELLDRERAEVAAVELELAARHAAVRQLVADFEAARDVAHQLPEAEARLAAASERRARELALRPEHAKLIADVDGRLAAERAALGQIREAHTAALGALGALELGIESMSSAHGLSVFDSFLDGGTVTSWIKYDELDGAVERLAHVHAALLALRPRLTGLTGEAHHPNLPMPSPLTATLDIWFDNVFSDLAAHRLISSSLSELRRSRASVQSLADELAGFEQVSRARVDAVEAERRALLRG